MRSGVFEKACCSVRLQYFESTLKEALFIPRPLRGGGSFVEQSECNDALCSGCAEMRTAEDVQCERNFDTLCNHLELAHDRFRGSEVGTVDFDCGVNRVTEPVILPLAGFVGTP